MARLTSTQPNYKSHAGLAKGRATQQFARGTLSSGQKASIDAQANRVIGHTFHSIKKGSV